jgi:hypothetical protein
MRKEDSFFLGMIDLERSREVQPNHALEFTK